MRLAYLCLATLLGLAIFSMGLFYLFFSSSDTPPTPQTSGSYNWWAWTPFDTVDDSGLSLLTTGYRPDQPINFDHSLHAGDNKIDCEYCHNSARRSPSAGIPPLNTCMGCHKFVSPNSPDIKIIKNKFENNEPIEWTRVHDLPDFVRFSHEVHVNAHDEKGNALFSCESCHGNVKGMTVVEQIAPLQMGWCVECHNQIRTPAQPGKPAQTNASVSCNTCHY